MFTKWLFAREDFSLSLMWGRGEVGETVILKCSFICNKSNVLSWGRREEGRGQQAYSWKPKDVMKEKNGQRKSHEFNG